MSRALFPWPLVCLAQGGDLTVVSEGLGRGSEFTATFELACADEPRESSSYFAASESAAGGSAHGATRWSSRLSSESSGSGAMAAIAHLMGRRSSEAEAALAGACALPSVTGAWLACGGVAGLSWRRAGRDDGGPAPPPLGPA